MIIINNKMNWNKQNKKSSKINSIYNSKESSIKILEGYFKKLKINELVYYLKDYEKSNSMEDFFDSNIHDNNKDLKNNFDDMLNEHYELAYDYVINYNELKNNLNYNNKLEEIKKKIKISIITDSIYWKNIFVISTNIFVNYTYIVEIKKKT